MIKLPVRLAVSALACALVLVLWAPLPLAAEEGLWDRPVNLSVSGVATAPQLVRGEEDSLYAYWWDQYDGLTAMRVDAEGLERPRPVPILDLSFDAQGSAILNPQTEAAIRVPVRSGGTLAGDQAGRVNVFFPATTAARIAPLRQTSTTLGSGQWAIVRSIAPGVAAWRSVTGPDGSIHLLFMYPGRTDAQMPGVYYMRSGDGGATWGDQVLVAESLYVRMADTDAHLDLAVGGEGQLYASWTEPGTNMTYYTWSRDGGALWVRPQLVDPDGPSAINAQVAMGADGQVLLVWQRTAATGEPVLMMSYTLDGGWNWTMPQRILIGRPIESAQLSLHSLPDGRVLFVIGGQQDGPSLAVWRAPEAVETVSTGLSELTDLRFPAHDLDTDAVGSVTAWQIALLGDDSLYMVGQCNEDDIWLLRARLLDEIWSDPETPIWSDPTADAVEEWQQLSRLARAGADMPLRIVAGRDGQMQAFWWHIYEGLTSAWFDGRSWMRPQHVRALVRTEPGEGQIPTQAELVSDGVHSVHAFWLDDGPEEPEEGEPGLWHSALSLGEHVWAEPEALGPAIAWRAAFGGDGTLHLLTLRDSAEEESPSGVYVRASTDDEVGWTEPVLLNTMAEAGAAGDNARLALAVQGRQITAAWDEAGDGPVRWARSEDDGESWSEPAAIPMSEAGGRWPVLAALSDGALLLYQSPLGDEESMLHQVYLDRAGRMTEYPDPVLTGLMLPSDSSVDLGLYSLEAETVLAVQRVGQSGIVVALWDSEQTPDAAGGWALLQDVVLPAIDPAQNRPIEWMALDYAVAGDRFAVLGLGAESELWALARGATRQSWMGEAPAWSYAERIGPVGAQDRAISVVSDAQGRVHAMWSAQEVEGEPGAALWYAGYADGRWSPPGAIIEPLDGVAQTPSIAAVGERLHAAWAGATGGQIHYASVFSVDADRAAAWPQPIWWPTSATGRDMVATHPQVRLDLAGRLHAVYAMPINQGRGVYYTRSENGGQAWIEAKSVFDAEAAGWAMVDRPTLAVDHDGTLYVAWMRMALLGTPRPMALYSAISTDGGVTWSAPKLVAEGNLTNAKLVVSAHGEPHLVWHEAGDRMLSAWHSYSQDAGATWSLPSRVRGLTRLVAEADVVANGTGQVYLVGILQGENERPHLLQATWNSAQGDWALEDARALSAGVRSVAVARLALEPVLGQLDLLLHAELLDEEGQEYAALLHMRRHLEPLEARPQPIEAPVTMPAPEPTPGAQPTPDAAPTVRMDAPPPQGDIIELGFFSVSALSIGGLLVAALMVAGVLVFRLARRR